MIRAIGHTLIARFERRFAYDAGYMHTILDASPAAFVKLVLAQALGAHAEAVSPAARYAARFAATRHEDCGPCAQLAIDMARAEGVSPPLLRAVVEREFAALPADAALALRFAEAVLAHEVPQPLQAEVDALFGARGRTTLACIIAMARTYPTLKRALASAPSCARLSVDALPATGVP